MQLRVNAAIRHCTNISDQKTDCLLTVRTEVLQVLRLGGTYATNDTNTATQSTTTSFNDSNNTNKTKNRNGSGYTDDAATTEEVDLNTGVGGGLDASIDDGEHPDRASGEYGFGEGLSEDKTVEGDDGVTAAITGDLGTTCSSDKTITPSDLGNTSKLYGPIQEHADEAVPQDDAVGAAASTTPVLITAAPTAAASSTSNTATATTSSAPTTPERRSQSSSDSPLSSPPRKGWVLSMVLREIGRQNLKSCAAGTEKGMCAFALCVRNAICTGNGPDEFSYLVFKCTSNEETLLTVEALARAFGANHDRLRLSGLISPAASRKFLFSGHGQTIYHVQYMGKMTCSSVLPYLCMEYVCMYVCISILVSLNIYK